ncbi:anaphase-promoting complex subunit 11 RING-H2 finger-domain-containing protein [Xylaria nigripes]|nr:anaphase-promoting complex subunit 11 RING-H2 finger-domain-containing protein [Xylaria nigripes]
MKVKITKWNAVATWRWDLPEDDVCGICQVHFDGTCPTCKYPGDDCSLCMFSYQAPVNNVMVIDAYFVVSILIVVSGKCGHNFHMHCIMEWIKQDSAKGQCPMCRQKFEWNEAGGGQQRQLHQLQQQQQQQQQQQEQQLIYEDPQPQREQ